MDEYRNISMNQERTQLYFFLALFIGICILALLILLPYLSSFVIASAFAVVFAPLHQKVRFQIKNESLASLGTLVIILVLFLVPILFLGTLIAREAVHLYATLQDNRATDLQQIIMTIQRSVESLVPTSWGSLNLAQPVQNALAWVVANISTVFTGILQGILSLALSLFMLYYLLKDGSRLRQFLVSHSPLPDTYDNRILERIENAVNSVLRGSLMIALIQGLLTGLGFAIFGVPSAPLWGGVAVIAALIPTFGTALVIAPAIIFLISTGNGGNAIGLAIWGAIAVGMIDNFLGPKLIGSRTHMHPLLTLLSVLGGLSFFGPIGFLLGPLVFSIFFAMLDIYVAISKGEAPPSH